jgi:exopolysaccharide production protein ExoZ
MTPSDVLVPQDDRPTSESGAAAPYAPAPAVGGEAVAPPSRKAHTIPALDGVRAIAASLVFLVHYQAAFGYLLGDESSGAFRFGGYLANVGYNGVNVFFVLSGYLIYGSLIGRPTPFAKFFMRRVRRIYPTFWAVLALYLVVGAIFPVRNKLPAEGAPLVLLENILLLPGVLPLEPIVTVAWSLSYELFFYLGLALAVGTFVLRRWTRAARVTLLVACLLVWVVGGRSVRDAVGSFVMFVPGLLLYEMRQRWPRVVTLSAAASAAIGVVVLLSLLAAPIVTRADLAPRMGSLEWIPVTAQVTQFLLLSVGTGLLILGALASQGAMERTLAQPHVRTIGLISYSFYLIHGATTNVVALGFVYLTGRTPLGLGWYLALMVPVYLACVGTSLVLFHAVEKRFSL